MADFTDAEFQKGFIMRRMLPHAPFSNAVTGARLPGTEKYRQFKDGWELADSELKILQEVKGNDYTGF